jgi:hypothetical protein
MSQSKWLIALAMSIATLVLILAGMARPGAADGPIRAAQPSVFQHLAEHGRPITGKVLVVAAQRSEKFVGGYAFLEIAGSDEMVWVLFADDRQQSIAETAYMAGKNLNVVGRKYTIPPPLETIGTADCYLADKVSVSG